MRHGNQGEVVSLDPDAVRAIKARLDGVAAGADGYGGVRILHAVESGSRAWGFPSPDSDYDCRFVYCRPFEAYAALRQPRDVIETPLDAVLDVNGWDLRKALLLALKGNAVIVEWARSPIVYRGEEGFAAALDALFVVIAPPALVARHYAGLVSRFTPTDWGEIRLKKLFYALRPLAALEWMIERGLATLPPMAFGDLLDGVDWDEATREEIDALLQAKARTHEMGSGPVPPAIAARLASIETLLDRLPTRSPEARAELREREALAEGFLLGTLRGEDPASLVP